MKEYRGLCAQRRATTPSTAYVTTAAPAMSTIMTIIRTISTGTGVPATSAPTAPTAALEGDGAAVSMSLLAQSQSRLRRSTETRCSRLMEGAAVSMSIPAPSRLRLRRSTGTPLPEAVVVSLSILAQSHSPTAKCIPTKLTRAEASLSMEALSQSSAPRSTPTQLLALVAHRRAAVSLSVLAQSRLRLRRSTGTQVTRAVVSWSGETWSESRHL